jgi:short-subunit dehydrogenase
MNIFIAGGTSGIGYGLAQLYLSKGFRVGVCGRNLTKTESLSPEIQYYKADVTKIESLEITISDFLSEHKTLDIFINCAGSYAEDVAGKISYQEAEEMLKTNILGSVNCFEIARQYMKNQNGKIAVIASVSGILDYENSSLYTKTKRSIIQIADAYRRALQPFGITITVVAPGYIDTEKLRELNANNLSKKPFLIDVETASQTIYEAIESNKNFIIFPKKMKWMMKSLSILPKFFLDKIMFRKAKWMKND